MRTVKLAAILGRRQEAQTRIFDIATKPLHKELKIANLDRVAILHPIRPGRQRVRDRHVRVIVSYSYKRTRSGDVRQFHKETICPHLGITLLTSSAGSARARQPLKAGDLRQIPLQRLKKIKLNHQRIFKKINAAQFRIVILGIRNNRQNLFENTLCFRRLFKTLPGISALQP